MDFPTVQNSLTDLPLTFKRPGTPFTQLIDALTAGLVTDTETSDNILQQATEFTASRFGWLDVWGLLFNVPRNGNESDAKYLARILYVVKAAGGTPVGMAFWIKNVWGLSATILEFLPAVGYTIQFNSSVSVAQLIVILQSLVRIRPAGVPFAVTVPSDGLYLNTINFLNGLNVTGAFLTGGSSSSASGFSAATNNTPPSLPDLFLVDPTLQGLVT